MPWLKRIDLHTGAASFVALTEGHDLRLEPRGPPFVTTEPRPLEPAVLVLSRGDAWHSRVGGSEHWLLHGGTLDVGDALYVFQEYPEARNLALEAELPTADDAALVYADWLEEQGDPFAAAVKPELAKERGPAGLWWLEGYERAAGLLQYTARAGFVRRAAFVGTRWQPWELELFHLLHLRALVALEELELDLAFFASRGMGAASSVLAPTGPVWRALPFPASLRRVLLTGAAPEAEVRALEETLKARGVTLETKDATRPVRGRALKA